MVEMDRASLERKRRILLAVAAYAYEKESESIMTDHEYDRLSLLIDPTIDTGRPELDKFFRTEFSPDTGQWIGAHPEFHKVADLYYKYYMGRENIVSK